jgi:hypothetical protein
MMQVLGLVVSIELAVWDLENLLQILSVGRPHNENTLVPGRRDIVRRIIRGLVPEILEFIPNRRIVHGY